MLKMKIALIYPNSGSDEKQIHLGLGYIASYVLSRNDDITVSVLDTGVATKKETDSFLKEEFDIVGITVTSNTYREALRITKTLKDKKSNARIVFGGPHVSIMMRELMEEKLIDFAVYGEGELTFGELITHIKQTADKNSIEELSNINGLIFRTNDQIVVNQPRALIKDLDVLPIPAYHLFPMQRYPGNYSMITSRGCPFSCTFCATSQIWGVRWRARSAANIIKEVLCLISEYGVRPLDFQDACFNTNLKRVSEICKFFVENKIRVPWTVRGFRADLLNTRLANEMRSAGCAFVALGIESANPNVLSRIGKKETKEQIADGIKILRSAGIDVLGQFMIGNPEETLENVKESIKFAQESNLTGAVFGTAVPFPKTDLRDYVDKHGKFLIERDCTRFEEIYPRVIFETPEFSKKDRIEAIRLARAAGLMPNGIKRSNLPKKLKTIFLGNLFKYLPRSISFQLYFCLRRIKS